MIFIAAVMLLIPVLTACSDLPDSGSTDTTLRCRLMDLESQLKGEHFLRPHRSYLVNCQYIFHIGKNELTLTDRSTVPVSRGKLEEIKQQFLRYTGV